MHGFYWKYWLFVRRSNKTEVDVALLVFYDIRYSYDLPSYCWLRLLLLSFIHVVDFIKPIGHCIKLRFAEVAVLFQRPKAKYVFTQRHWESRAFSQKSCSLANFVPSDCVRCLTRARQSVYSSGSIAEPGTTFRSGWNDSHGLVPVRWSGHNMYFAFPVMRFWDIFWQIRILT